MKAYKFRGAEQFQFALDIMLNQRIYCPDWSNLNDPMEGVFAYSSRSGGGEELKKNLSETKAWMHKWGVGSLSRTFDCHLLWAHYASGFSGMAIEVELPDSADEVELVSYGGVFGHVSEDDLRTPKAAARTILTSKNSEWSYEDEVRILLDKDQKPDRYYTLPCPVKRVITGPRMLPALFDALVIICHAKNIKLATVGIGNEGIDADYFDLESKHQKIVGNRKT